MKVRFVNIVFLTLSFTLQLTSIVNSQKIDLKQEAKKAFKAENYPGAISLLKQALAENQDDAEIFYLLGYYTHYLSNDSRPLANYSEEMSDQILDYLFQAVKMKPDYGNAYYFIGAEYGARFGQALQNKDIQKMRGALLTGREKGGFPDWLLEYGRNTLRSCQLNAILFTGGDSEINPIRYLQIIEGYRTDVLHIPIPLLRAPWFVLILKNGLENIYAPAPISWSQEQILSMHPYKWKTNIIKIPFSKDDFRKYQFVSKDGVMNWTVEPDLSSNSRTYLSPRRALIVDIIETNRWQRPVYFTVGCREEFKANLGEFMQICGMVYKVLPINTKEYNLALYPEKVEAVLLQPNHFRDFKDVKQHDMPRASRLLNNYRSILFKLANHYIANGDNKKALNIFDFGDMYLPEDIFPILPAVKKALQKIRAELKSH